jgi:hypothetical protein
LFSKKGKRKIIIDDATYLWCVTTDKETGNSGIEPLKLQVFSEEKHLFTCLFEYENKRWEPSGLNSRTLILGEVPQISPSVVREKIIDYLSK